MPIDTEHLKSPLTDAEPEALPSLPLPGEHISLSPLAKKRLAERLASLHKKAKEARAAADEPLSGDWSERMAEKRSKALPSITDADGNPHGAYYPLPILNAVVDTWVGQVTQAIWADPLAEISPGVGDSDPERAIRFQDFLEDWNDRRIYLRDTLKRAVERVAMEGVGVVYIPYRRITERELTRTDPETGTRQLVDRMTLEGPVPEVVARERVYLWPSDAKSLQEAWALFYEYRLPIERVKARKKSGFYKAAADEWKRVLATPGENATEMEESDRPIEDTGTEAVEVSMVDVYCPYGFTGGEEPCVFTLCGDVLLRGTLSLTGSWKPFEDGWALLHGDNWCGVSLPSLCYDIAKLVNIAISQDLDDATINHLLKQTVFVSEQSGMDPNEPWLGVAHLVRGNPRDVLGWAQIPTTLDTREKVELFFSLIEKVTGVSTNFMGSLAPVQKTAKEVDVTSTAANVRFQESIYSLESWIKRILEGMRRQWYTNAPDEGFTWQGEPDDDEKARMLFDATMQEQARYQQDVQTAAMMGVDPSVVPPPNPQVPETISRTIRPEDFAPGLDIEPQGGKSNVSRDQQVQEAMMLQQMLSESPFVQADAARLYELTMRVLQALKVKNPQRIIGPKPDAGTPVPQLMAQMVAYARTAGGITEGPGMPMDAGPIGMGPETQEGGFDRAESAA